MGECVPAAMQSPELKQLILVGPTRSGVGYIASVTHLPHGSLPLPFCLLLSPTQQYWIAKNAHDLMQCQMVWKWQIYKLREPQQNGSNKLRRESYILNWYTGFCSNRLTISSVYITPYSSLGQIKINWLILD